VEIDAGVKCVRFARLSKYGSFSWVRKCLASNLCCAKEEAVRERSEKELAIFQLVVGLAYGGALVGVADHYGWASQAVIWMTIGGLFLVTGYSFWDVRRRLARIEKRLGERAEKHAAP